jgi:putative membrane protein
MSAAVRWAMLAGVLAMLGLAAAGPDEAAPPVSAQDRAFMVTAHRSNLTAIAAGQAVRQKASATEVRALAGRLVADHHNLDAELQDVAARLGVALPDRPATGQQRQLAGLTARTGADFDRAWIASQIAGDRQAVAAGHAALSGDGLAEVIALARSATPVLEQHLSMLQQAGSGRIATGTTTTGTGGRSVGQSGWARPAGRVLTVLGLVLIAFAALFPGRSGRGEPRPSGQPQPRTPPLPRHPEQHCAVPVSAAAQPVGAVAAQRPARHYPAMGPARHYPATWKYLTGHPIGRSEMPPGRRVPSLG